MLNEKALTQAELNQIDLEINDFEAESIDKLLQTKIAFITIPFAFIILLLSWLSIIGG